MPALWYMATRHFKSSRHKRTRVRFHACVAHAKLQPCMVYMCVRTVQMCLALSHAFAQIFHTDGSVCSFLLKHERGEHGHEVAA